jgi:hypothetical protein
MLTISNLEDESVEWLVGAISEFVVQGFVTQVLAEHSGISSEAGDGHADVVLDLKDLILVAGQLGWQFLETAKDDKVVGAQSEADGALLDRLHGVLDLEELALRRPGSAVEVVESL